jgi:hypothetical protein
MSGHRTPQAARLYIKRTDHQRAWSLPEPDLGPESRNDLADEKQAFGIISLERRTG